MSITNVKRPSDRTYFIPNRIPCMQFCSSPLSGSFDQTLHNNMNLFNNEMRIFSDMINDMGSMFDNPSNTNMNIVSPFVDPFTTTFSFIGNGEFIKKDGKYVWELEIEKNLIDCVKVKEKDRIVIVTAEKITVKEENIGGIVSKSSSTQKFNKSLRLPEDGIDNTATAKYSCGKLQIIVDSFNTYFQLSATERSIFEKYVSEHIIKTYDRNDKTDIDYVFGRLIDNLINKSSLSHIPTKKSFIKFLNQREFNVVGNTINNTKFVDFY